MLIILAVICFVASMLVFLVAQKGMKELKAMGFLLLLCCAGFLVLNYGTDFKTQAKIQCDQFEGSDIKSYMVERTCYVEVEPGIYQNTLSRNVELRSEAWVKEHKN